MLASALFTPFTYKSLTLKNRFVLAPMTRQRSPGGVPTPEVRDYYARRAASVGLLLSEGTVVERPAAKFNAAIPDFYGPAALAGWQRVGAAVHAAGGRMGPQLWHVGDVPPDAAGSVPPDATGWRPPTPYEGPATMSVEAIQATIAAFAQAAASAQALGFDCVELHGGHGYLLDQFFWARTNPRRDDYGGATLGARTRFAGEVVRAVRQAVGPDFTILLRLSQWKGDDYAAKMATTPAELDAWLQPLAAAGVDIFHCSQRRYWEAEFLGSDLNFAGWAKKLTGQPTITVGSVGLSADMLTSFAGEKAQPHGLGELLRRYERGDFDLVAVGRALLQDPEWVQKIETGRTDELLDFSAASLRVLH